MSGLLDYDDCLALLKHYDVGVADRHQQYGTTMTISGGPAPDAERTIVATIGDHHAERICPLTDFLAEGMVAELGDSRIIQRPQLRRAIAHLLVNLSRMQVESVLASFSLQAMIEGDRYEVLPKTAVIDATSRTIIPHRLGPHAHDDRGRLHASRSDRK